MPPSKKRKLEEEISKILEAQGDESDVQMSDRGSQTRESDEWSSGEQDSQDSEQSGDSPDTEEEIAIAQIKKKSKKTAKRKIRASSPSQFGNKLEALLTTEAPVGVPLALKKSINRRRKDEKDTLKARKAAGVERKEHEEMGRITDVIGGWGGENERALRKVAQRGVVQLFNVVQKAQSTKAAEESSKIAMRGSGKPTLEKPDLSSKHKKKRSIVPSQNEIVEKDVFMDAIRSGGVVSRV